MAGDWIKVEKITPEKPEILRIATILRRNSDEIFGKIFKLWAWADDHTQDGKAMDITEKFIDKKVGKKGFAQAMRQVGWLDGSDGTLVFPGFHRHNGETAKERADTNRRVAEHRARNGKSVTKTVHPVTANPLQKPLPEKRREEKSKESLDSLPGAESEHVEKEIRKLRPEWRLPLTAAEHSAMAASLPLLAGMAASEWDTLRRYLAFRLPQGVPGWQPRSRRKFLETVEDAMSYALQWQAKRDARQRASSPAPQPADDEPPLTTAEMLAILRRPKPGPVLPAKTLTP